MKVPIKPCHVLAHVIQGYMAKNGTEKPNPKINNKVRQEISRDLEHMTEEEFRKKYNEYIY